MANADDYDDEERWVKHYSSNHEILLVGDGDFSFSLALAFGFHSASNIVATSLDSKDTVVKKYGNARSNLEVLETMGATVLHGVDATTMKLHSDLKMRKFDRIVYNFPHAGFKGKEDQIHLIKLHRQLVHGFFRNARHMLRPYGEIHVSHKMEIPYNKWKLEELAFDNSLMMIECAPFDINDYPGYNNKRGDGLNCDQPFRLGECCTYKFTIGDIHVKKQAHKVKAAISHMNDVNVISGDRLRITPEINHSFEVRYPQADYMHKIIGRPEPTLGEGLRTFMCSPPRSGLIRPPLIDTERIPARLCTHPGIQSSFHQSDFANGPEGNSRWISRAPETMFEISAAGYPRRLYSPPRYGASSSLSSRAYGDCDMELRNTITRFGSDFRHAEESIADGYIRDMIRRFGSDFRYAEESIADGHIREVVAKCTSDYRHAEQDVVGTLQIFT